METTPTDDDPSGTSKEVQQVHLPHLKLLRLAGCATKELGGDAVHMQYAGDSLVRKRSATRC